MKRCIGILVLACVVLVGCNNPNNPVGKGTGKQPGKFSATVLSDAMGGARGVSLGTFTVANSKSIYFILRNVGDFPITDITLTPGKLNKDDGAFVPITDNGVTASPGAIAVLETSGKANVESVIEVDINHGDIVGLIAQQYIHKADFAGTTLRITGKTTNEKGAALDISLDADIETLIKVASFEIVYGDNFTPATTYNMESDQMRYLVPSSAKNKVRLHNTSNVSIFVKIRRNPFPSSGSGGGDSWEFTNSWEEVLPNAYSAVFTHYTGPLYPQYLFIVDTRGVAFDNKGNDDLGFRSGTSIVRSYYNDRQAEASTGGTIIITVDYP